jgi:diguanylate cyclase (GGDEF)-like protein/PAS domain S-box-containing protein
LSSRLVELSPDLLFATDLDGQLLEVNPAWERSLGWTAEELVGRSLHSLWHPADLEATRTRWAAPGAGGTPFEARIRGRDGTHRPFLWTVASARAAPFISGVGRDASWLQRERELLREGELRRRDHELHEQVRLLLESTSEGIYGLDAEGRCTFINPAGARLLGYAAEELHGRDFHALVHHSRADGTPYPREECPAERAQRSGAGVRTDVEVLWRKDGTSFAADWSAYPIGPGGGLFGTLADISVRKRAEDALRKTHGVLQSIIEGTTDAVTVTDLDGRYLLVNPAAARFLSLQPESMLGKDAAAFFPAETARALREADHRVIEGNEARSLEETIVIGERTLTLLSTKGPYRDHRGQVIGVIAISRDITERKRMEATLRLQADALQLLQTIAIAANEAPSVDEAVRVALARLCFYARWPLGCALTQPRASAPLALQAWHLAPSHLAQPQADELARFATGLELPARVFALAKPEWIPDFEGLPDRARARAARALGVRGAFALPVTADGAVLGVLLLFSPEPIEPDAPLIVVLANAASQLGLVVQRKRGEQTLRASEERNRLILETATDAFIGLDEKGRILEWNRQAVDTFGWSREGAVGRSLLDTVVQPHSREALSLQALFTSGDGPALGKRSELQAVRSDGRQFPAEMTIWAAPDGGTQRYNAFVHDITERKRAEEALRNANEKLTSWVSELERRNREVSLLNEMGDLLQSCLTAEEANSVVAQFVQQLFPEESGALFVLARPRNVLDAVSTWGKEPPAERLLSPEDCWALRRGRVHAVSAGGASGPRCKHLATSSAPGPTVCVPLLAQGEALGMLFLQESGIERNAAAEHATEAKRRLALTVGEHVSLSLANFKLRETLRDQSIRDALTGLYNRRYMEETLDRELRRAERKQRTLGVILIDVDHFKNYNDALGHEAGDALLRGLADFFRAQVRREDIVCRFGGEEFTLLLPEASIEIARERAENLRERVKELRVEHRGLPLGSVTLSFGVAVYPGHGVTAEELFRSADAALYRAKAAGRDRVEMGRPPETALSGGEAPVAGRRAIH